MAAEELPRWQDLVRVRENVVAQLPLMKPSIDPQPTLTVRLTWDEWDTVARSLFFVAQVTARTGGA